ncbi:MAG TPA: hypothetical protein PKO06_15045, partial [Candidatus Ozemobacteraceae bacterium]|nr:hypothetical protein [Candidatus Ozemobacteraceae bacterium]
IELRDITQTRDKSRRDLEIASFIIHRFPELTEKMTELSKDLSRENPSTSEFLETLREVNRQVNKMMAFTELEAGPLRIQRMPINLEELITEVCEMHAELVQERKITVKTSFSFGDESVEADDDWLKKLLSILLENAIMYTEEGAEVLIQTEKTSEGRFRCRIQNPTDFTLDVEQAHRYFDLRTQLEEFESFQATDFSLELPLARHIVEAHSGVIFIEPDRENLFSVVFDI